MLLGCTSTPRKRIVAKLSLLFPVRDRKIHVFHKSVRDWLVNTKRQDEKWWQVASGWWM